MFLAVGVFVSKRLEKNIDTQENEPKNNFLIEKPHHNTETSCHCWQEIFVKQYQESRALVFILVI